MPWSTCTSPHSSSARIGCVQLAECEADLADPAARPALVFWHPSTCRCAASTASRQARERTCGLRSGHWTTSSGSCDTTCARQLNNRQLLVPKLTIYLRLLLYTARVAHGTMAGRLDAAYHAILLHAQHDHDSRLRAAATDAQRSLALAQKALADLK